jgi:hypothetical protein
MKGLARKKKKNYFSCQILGELNLHPFQGIPLSQPIG